jgi:uncharacterized membrane protein YdbT with pleckstrin-like domain
MDARQMIENKNRDLPSELRSGEKILVTSIVSGGIYWKAIAVFTFAIILFLLAPPLGFFMSFVAFLIFAYAYIIKSINSLIVTNQRIFMRSGLVKIDTIQIRLERIEAVEIQRTLVGQFLGYATLVITGTGTTFAYLPFLANAPHIRNVLDDLLYKRDQIKPES